MSPWPDPSPDFQRETAVLRRVARGIVFEPGLAEDAVQEAWLAALRQSKVGVVSGGWLHDAVRRIALGLRRREARRASRERSAARTEHLPSTSETSARLELFRELLAALEALEEPYRTAVQMRLVDDLPPRAIAARLGVPIETARTRVKRGLERLRARLDAQNAHRRDEFLGALAPLALGHGIPATFAATHAYRTIQGAWMGANSKLVAAVAVALVAGLVWLQPWKNVASDPGGLANVGADAVIATPLDGAHASNAIEAPAHAKPDARVAVTGAEVAANGSNATWVVRGRVLRDRGEPFPGVELHVIAETGYEGPGEILHDDVLRTDAQGAFEVAWTPPASAVRVRANAEIVGYYVSSAEVLVVRGGDAPRKLLVAAYALDVVVRGRVLDEHGSPVRDAHVACISHDVTTDGDGRYEVRSSSSFDTARVHAWAHGFAEEERAVVAGAPGTIEGIDFHLGADQTLRGRVVDENARPVEGAEIACFTLERARTRSGSDGRFTLEGLRPDKSWVSVGIRAPGFARLRVAYPDGAPIGTEPQFVLLRGLDLAGRVADEAGRGIPGAELYAGNSQFDVDVVTAVAGDDGRFVLRDLPRTIKTIHVEAQGFAPIGKDLHLPANGPAAEVLVTLSRGLEVAGLVEDAAGTPIAEVSVSVRRDGDYLANLRATTNEQGRFRLADVPDGRGLALEFYAKDRVRKTVEIDPAQVNEMRVVLDRAAGLAGRVVDQASGQPVPAFRVRFVTPETRPGDTPLGAYTADWSSPGRDFRSETGEWRVEGEELNAGAVVGLEISAPGHGPTIVPRAMTTLEPDKDPIVVTLGPAARLGGFVVDHQGGRPIEGASVRVVPSRVASSWVALNDDDRERMSATTDAAGAFRFDELALEPVSLFVERDGYAPMLAGPFDVALMNPALTLELSHGATLRGVLRAFDSRAVPGAAVNVSTGGDAGRPYRSWSLQTDDRGAFELRDLAPGVYQVARMLKHDHGAVYDLSKTVTIVGEDTVEVEIRPSGHCSLNGTLRGSELPRIATVSAFTTDASDPKLTQWRAAVANDGHFEIDGLTPGVWRILVSEISTAKRRHGSAEVNIGPDAKGDVSVTVDLLGP